MKQRKSTDRCCTGTAAQIDKSNEDALAIVCSIVPDRPQTFSHPDYTVGPGIAPSPALRLAGLCGHATITADQEFHLAPKVFGLCRCRDMYEYDTAKIGWCQFDFRGLYV